MAKKDGKAAGPVRLTKLTAEIPVDVETRLHGLARTMRVPKRELVAKLLDAGLRRYEADGHFRAIIAGLIRTDDAAA